MESKVKSLIKPRVKTTSSVVVGLSYVGAFIGAGFISGQELAQFFIQFGLWGIIAWIVASLIIIVGGGLMLEKISQKKPESFDKFVELFFGKKTSWFVNLIINGYLFGGLIIMISGASGLLTQLFNLNPFYGVFFVSLLMFAVIVGKGTRILNVNKFLVPILILLTALTAFKVIFDGDNLFDLSQDFIIKNPSFLLRNWWLSVLFYAGYNAIGAIVGLVNIARESSAESAKRGGFFGGVVIVFLGSLLMYTLLVMYPQWQFADLPLVSVLQTKYPLLYKFFSPAMLIAMFTCATAYALGLSKYFQEKLPNYDFRIICAGILSITAPIALFGFSRLLGTIYPFFGIMATTILITLVAKYFLFQLVARFSKGSI